jgi:phospholipid/cholesterol/gamma-HCH transport system ATP-binding protein
MPEPLTILTIDSAECAAKSGGSLAVQRLMLREADLLVVHVQPRVEELPPLCDLAAGLLTPPRGVVRFMGCDWRDAGAYRQAAMRGLTGRVFGGQAWVSNLSVSENVLLPRRHHTRRPERDLLDDAAALGREFGLRELPSDRPETVRPHDLIRWQWVRAFLGAPKLLLLEEPERDAWNEHRPLLRERTCRRAAEGAAVIWVTRDGDAWRGGGSPAVLHATVADGNLSLESGC